MIDGSDASSTYATTDWGISAPAEHSFNAIASAVLQPGSHTIVFTASDAPGTLGAFNIGSSSGLGILVRPVSDVVSSFQASATANINLTTYNPGMGIDTVEGGANRPTVDLMDQTVAGAPTGSGTQVVSLISGTAFHSCNSGIDGGQGDALWGIWSNPSCQSTHQAAWSVNDIISTAELTAAMYAHSAYPLTAGQTATLSFRASELAFGSNQAGSPSGSHENGVCYKVQQFGMISTYGGSVVGSAPGGSDSFCSTYTFKCVASTMGTSGCPSAGTYVTIGSTTVNIPASHDGIVMFSAKTRIQGADGDGFSTVVLGIKIDGLKVGTTGTQELVSGHTASSRTLTAMYLSAPGPDSSTLSTGSHTVEVYINVSGISISSAAVPQDVVLTYFD